MNGSPIELSDISVERSLHVERPVDGRNPNDKQKNKNTLTVKNVSVNPNIVFFRSVDVVKEKNKTLIADIAFSLWMLIKTN